MSTTTHPDTDPELEAAEVSILETLEEEDAVRRVDLADGIEDYPTHETALLDRNAIGETGSLTTSEDGDHVTYRRFVITSTGEGLLDAHRSPPPKEQDPVEPMRTPDSGGPWDVTAPWDELSPSIAQILDETQSVECIETDRYRGGWMVRVELARDETEGQIEFEPIKWHNASGAHHFKTQYRHLFGGWHPDVSKRAFGALQRAWVAEFAEDGD